MDFAFKLDYLLVGLMQVIGFFIQGTTGFGCTVIAAPITNGLLGTTMGVPYGTAITIPFLYYLAIKGRKDISWPDLGKIVLLCAPGILIGQYLFYQISPETAKVLIGAMVTVIALMNLHKYVVKPLVIKEIEENEVADTLVKRIFRYGCLILGGIVHGAFNIGGPLITVYTLEAVKDKKKFRNTMTMLWVVLNSWNLFNQHQNGAFTSELNSALLVGLPLAGIGFFFGMRFLEKINREQFLRIVYVVLLIIGSNMLLSNIPWTADSKMMSMVGTVIVLSGYAFNVFKKRKVNIEKVQAL
ncbi:sulfite exporter TauE/SafE family protein [Photobacterium japonica]|uniref:sulfite exporter TauE/SafE family protein n=1 Tax=Photobacterium japonica TaxID=2910235 RepID=UPI003D0C3578